MIKLFGLELQQNPLKKYLLTIFAIAAFLLGLTYLFAYIPHKNSSIAIEMTIIKAIAPVFSNYRSIAGLTSILSMVCFAVFSAAVFNQFVINDFIGKRFYLLLSYPIKKSTIFLAKVIAAITVSILAMLLCNALVFTIFYYIETMFPMVMGDTLSIGVFQDTVKLTLLFSVISAAIGLISMRIGFIKKSSHIALINSFACSVLLSNLLGISLLADLVLPGVNTPLYSTSFPHRNRAWESSRRAHYAVDSQTRFQRRYQALSIDVFTPGSTRYCNDWIYNFFHYSVSCCCRPYLGTYK